VLANARSQANNKQTCGVTIVAVHAPSRPIFG